MRAATGAWESTWKFDREDRDAEHRLVFGGALAFAELLAHPPREDETGDGWDAGDPTRSAAAPGVCGRGCWRSRR